MEDKSEQYKIKNEQEEKGLKQNRKELEQDIIPSGNDKLEQDKVPSVLKQQAEIERVQWKSTGDFFYFIVFCQYSVNSYVID